MTTNYPFISIIVPVYNVQQYLEKCLDSILVQTYDNYELIVVNDCSPDDSQKIINSYKENDSRIISIINSENKGLGGARNIGIKHAKGDYLLFIDSDDFISDEFNLNLLAEEVIGDNSLDVIDCKYNVVNGSKSEILPVCSLDSKLVLDGKDYLNKADYLAVVAWNKLYRRLFILENNIWFKERRYEDICFTLESIFRAKSVKSSGVIFYNYIIREGSIMTSKVSEEALLDAMSLCYDLESLYIMFDENPQIEKSFFYSFVGFMKLLDGFTEKVFKNKMKKELSLLHFKYRYSILKAKKLGFIQKVSLFISPQLTLYILKLIKK